LTQFREQYQALIEDIRMMMDCPILLMEPFIFPLPAEYALWEPELHKMSEIIQQLADTNHAEFLPLWEDLLSTAKKEGFSEITTDGIHLTASGHKMITDHWLRNFRLHLLPA